MRPIAFFKTPIVVFDVMQPQCTQNLTGENQKKMRSYRFVNTDFFFGKLQHMPKHADTKLIDSLLSRL